MSTTVEAFVRCFEPKKRKASKTKGAKKKVVKKG
jgi:hypothetical protein